MNSIPGDFMEAFLRELIIKRFFSPNTYDII
jgi:hypothetical protein